MLNTLIIGCGNIAGVLDAERPADALPFTHAGAYARHGGFAASACVDPDPGYRARFQARWGVPGGAESVAELSAEPGRFDVISICSPTAFHAEHLDAAIVLQPRLIFCEKPFAASAAEGEALARRCADAGILLAVNYTRRWDPALVELAQALRVGTWGKIRSVSAVYGKGIIHNGGHLLDLLDMLLGAVEIVAVGEPNFDFWPDDPSVPALLQSRDAVPISLMINHADDYALFECTIVGERGTVAMLDGGRRWMERVVGPSAAFAGYQALGEPVFREGSYDQAMSLAVANIAAALDNGTALASNAENALRAQRVCEYLRDQALGRRAN